MTPGTYPDFLKKLIESPPAAGSGVHDWMFNVSRNLHAHMPAGQIESLLRSKLANCGRPVPDREIKDAIKRSVDFAWQPKGEAGGARAAVAPKPKPDPVKIEGLARAGMRVADMWHASPVVFDTPCSENVVDQLFPGNLLLCCGLSAMEFDTLKREEWRGRLHRQSFIVPSPMTTRMGKTQDGKDSAHCKANTGPRRFLVIEFDFSEFARDGKTETAFAPMLRSLADEQITVQDICSALLMCLNETIPMTLAVSSGGKSIHGWWYCEGQTDERLQTFWRRALAYNADPRTWLASQFIRMPDGTRDNGKDQPVLYFNPATLPDYAARV